MRNHFLRAAAGRDTGIVTSGLVLYLDAGDSNSYPGSGTAWYDLSAEGNNGTLTGATYSSADGGSIAFDGANDYVTISNDIRSDVGEFLATVSNQFSISTWFKPDVTDIGRNAIFTKAAGYGSAGNVYLEYSGIRLSAVIRGSATDNFYTSLTSTWHELAVTWDGTTFKAYVNGSFVSNLSVGTATSQDVAFLLGNSSNLGEDFEGNISIALVYDKALTASEVQKNFDVYKDRYGLS